MRRLPIVVAAICSVAGCASAPVYQRVSSAPVLPPSESVIVVERQPVGGVLIGTADLQLSVHQLPEECTAALLAEAKRAGATYVVMPPVKPGTSVNGPRCTLQAYYVPPK